MSDNIIINVSVDLFFLVFKWLYIIIRLLTNPFLPLIFVRIIH